MNLAVLALLGCSPALNWREITLPDAQLALMFPCKPEQAQQNLPLPNAPSVRLHVRACEADGQLFALAFADVPNPAHLDLALRTLLAATERGLQQSAQRLPAPVLLGTTPQPSAGLWRIEGTPPDGVPRYARMVLAAHGLRVVQLSWLSRTPATDERLEVFTQGLRFLP